MDALADDAPASKTAQSLIDDVLKVDPNFVFAIDGLGRAVRRARGITTRYCDLPGRIAPLPSFRPGAKTSRIPLPADRREMR
jgi:hypothetical protein